MTQVNLEQLRSAQAAAETIEPTTINQTSTHESELKVLQDELDALKISKETREKELTDYIGKAAADREQIIHTYTSYGQQLTAQIEMLTSELNDKKMENHSLQC